MAVVALAGPVQFVDGVRLGINYPFRRYIGAGAEAISLPLIYTGVAGISINLVWH